MAVNQKSLLCDISETQFVCIELQLYLDTHPEDAAALHDFMWYSQKLGYLIKEYEEKYGPLLNFGISATDTGSWVNSKWPWE